MGRDVVEMSAAARGTFDAANRVLGFDLADICFNGPADRLNATEISQPVIFVTSVAIWKAIQENAKAAAAVQPAAAAGLSLGEYTALWLAGSLSFEEGLSVVRQRGQFMQEAADARSGGMVSVMGLNATQVAEVCRDAGGTDTLAPANFNSPGQVVISGDLEACNRSIPLIEAKGGRGIPLRVAGAFHSPLMAPAAEKLRPVLARTNFGKTGIPVVSNVTADYHQSLDQTRDLLRVQVAEPIRWCASIERLIGDGFDRFVEVGPGRVLTGLMRGINRGVKAVNVSSAKALLELAGA